MYMFCPLTQNSFQNELRVIYSNMTSPSSGSADKSTRQCTVNKATSKQSTCRNIRLLTLVYIYNIGYAVQCLRIKKYSSQLGSMLQTKDKHGVTYI